MGADSIGMGTTRERSTPVLGVVNQGQGWNHQGPGGAGGVWPGCGGHGGYYPPLPIPDYGELKTRLLEVVSVERALVTIDETENGYIVKHAGKTYVCLTDGLTTLLESLLRK